MEKKWQNDKKFEVLMNNVLKNEGELTNHKNDLGGNTNWGITQKNYNEDLKDTKLPKKDVSKLTKDEVMVYYYWKYTTFKVDKIQEPNLAYVYFDFAIHSGYDRAARTLQKIIKVQKIDGIVGKDTLRQLNNLKQEEQRKLPFTLLEDRKRFLNSFCDNNPDQECFRDGFQNRMNTINTQITKGIVISGSSQSSSVSWKQQQNLGGIDCNPELNQLNKIKGVSKLNPKFLIDTQENINISDLTTALSVFLDPDIPEIRNKYLLVQIQQFCQMTQNFISKRKYIGQINLQGERQFKIQNQLKLCLKVIFYQNKYVQVQQRWHYTI